jgi:hypothetical protein
MKEAPFAYVLYIEHEHGRAETLVSVHASLAEAEDALRDYVAGMFVGHFRDDEIVETLIEEGQQARIYACAWEHTKKRKTQTSVEVEPFAHSMAA